MKKTLETPLDELLLKQNILQSDIDTVVNTLFEIFKKSSANVFGKTCKKSLI